MSAIQFAIASSSNQTVKSPRRRSPSLYSAQLRTWYFFCFACLYWLRLGYFMVEHTSATTRGAFCSQPERCNNAGFAYEELALGPATTLSFGGRVEHNDYNPEMRQEGEGQEEVVEGEGHGHEEKPTPAIPRSFTSLSGSVGLRYDFTRTIAFVGNFTSSDRPPALEELYNFGPHGRCCTARSKSLTSLCRLQSHPAQYVSGIPSAAILLSISHPIRCSTRCLANVRARISGPMIAL